MFFTRLLSSIELVLVALVTLLRGGYLLAAVLLLISLVAYRELCKACNLNMDAEEKSVNALEAVGYAGIVVCYMSSTQWFITVLLYSAVHKRHRCFPFYS